MSNNPLIAEHGRKTRWKPGKSANPAGKPKGTKNMTTLARELLEDPQQRFTLQRLVKQRARGDDGKVTIKETLRKISMRYPAKVILMAMIVKAAEGDVQAANFLRKTAYGDKIDMTVSRDSDAERWFRNLTDQEQELAEYAAGQLAGGAAEQGVAPDAPVQNQE